MKKNWQCKCGLTIGADHDTCPVCSIQKRSPISIPESRMRDRCASCENKFDNNLVDYNFRGNYCPDCSIRIDNKVKWISIKNFILKKTRESR